MLHVIIKSLGLYFVRKYSINKKVKKNVNREPVIIYNFYII